MNSVILFINKFKLLLHKVYVSINSLKIKLEPTIITTEHKLIAKLLANLLKQKKKNPFYS